MHCIVSYFFNDFLIMTAGGLVGWMRMQEDECCENFLGSARRDLYSFEDEGSLESRRIK